MGARHLQLALSYAELGWQVFPVHSVDADGKCSCHDPGGPNCSPGKHPRTRHGLKDATDLEETVVEWWSRWPDANIGIATGEASGLWVLDVDIRFDRSTGEIKTDGEASLAKLEADNEALPSTMTAKTGGGGRHIYFAWDSDVPVGCPGGMPKGIDIKGEGGYVLAPPSLHASGIRYAWLSDPETSPLAPAPPWLVRRVLSGPERGHGSPPAGDSRDPPQAGTPAPCGPLAAVDGVDEEMLQALATIPPNVGYEDWLAVAMGLHEETGGSEAGFGVFLSWSARAEGLLTPSGKPAFAGEGGCRAKWNSFSTSIGKNSRGRRTVFDIAIRRFGFRPLKLPEQQNDASPAQAMPALSLKPEWIWDRHAAPEFPIDEAFPPALTWLREFLKKLAWTYQVPVDLPVLLAAPIAMSALAGKLEVKVPGERWKEPAVLWTICAMTSGSGKSPVHRDLIRPVREWEKALDNSSAEAEHATRLMLAESDIKRALREVEKTAKGLNEESKKRAADELLEANKKLAFAKASVVTSDAIIASEATSERLVELLQRSQGRVLVSDSEGDTFDVAMGRYSSGAPNLGPWLKGYDGDQIKQERIGGDRVVHRPLINVGVATQPEALQFLSDKVAQGRGFVARFAAAIVSPSVGRRFMPGRDMEDAEFSQWERRITELLNVKRIEEPDEITLSEEARREFAEWGQDLFSEMDKIEIDEGEDPRDAWHRKYPGKVLRIALLLHGIQEDGLRRAVIDLHTMRAAIAWGQYLAGHNKSISATLRDDPELRIAERALEWLDRKGYSGKTFTRRDLQRGLQGGRSSVKTVHDLAGPLAVLVETNWITGIGKPVAASGPRPQTWKTYQVNASLSETLDEHRAAPANPSREKLKAEDGRPKRW